MPAPFKTEVIVLRSIRYGEADRILHLYSQDHGRLSAIAKGVRRVKSRLGGRIEPFARVNLILRQGRGELCTITGADTVHAHPALRERRASLERATQACDAVLRLLDSAEANPPAYNLLAHELALLDASPEAAVRAQALTFRLKLLLAAGFAPELAGCASCGEREHLGAFGRGGRDRLPGLRGGLLPAGRGGARVPGRGAGAPAGGLPGRVRPRSGAGGSRDRGDARAPRSRPSQTRRVGLQTFAPGLRT